jgi:hypothetical protein
MKLPSTSRWTLLSLLARRAQVWLRGTWYRERSASQILPEVLTRLDVSWSVACGLGMVDPVRGAYLQARSLLQALQTGEPYRIARALAVEASHVAVRGRAVQKRTAKLLTKAEAIGERIGHPHAQGTVLLAKGVAAQLEGRWKEALTLCQKAETVLRDRCTGVTWELDTAQGFSLFALFEMGQLAELSRRLPVLLKEAQERGDLYALLQFGIIHKPFLRLMADDPDGAQEELNELLGQCPQQGFFVQQLNGLFTQLQIDLYRGRPQAAWQRLTEHRATLARSLLLHVQLSRCHLWELRTRLALAMVATTSQPEPFLREAERDIRRLRSEKIPWADAQALLEEGVVAVRRGLTEKAITSLRSAADHLDQVDMRFYAVLARRCLGDLLGGAEGDALVLQADSWMREQGIQNPERMIGSFVPIECRMQNAE